MAHWTNIKTLPDGRAMLNLGCGSRTHPQWNNVDFSAYAKLAKHPRLSGLLRKAGVLNQGRYDNLQQIDKNILAYDLRKNVPFADGAFDVVYHSHFLEHLDRDVGLNLMKQCLRVLKPGGVVRVVVPDLGAIINRYNQAREQLARGDDGARAAHLQAIDDLFDQMVRIEPGGISRRPPGFRQIERLLRGNAAQTGEQHRWMYDAFSLCDLLRQIGFVDVKNNSATESRIKDWPSFLLDVNPDGSIHKVESLYVEGVRP